MRAVGDGAITSIILAARRPVCDLDGAEPLDHRFQNGRGDSGANRHLAVFRLYRSWPFHQSRRNVGDVTACCSLSSCNRLPHRHPRIARRHYAMASRSDETGRQVSHSDAGMFLTGQYLLSDLPHRLRRARRRSSLFAG